jgi:hypothetical protein
MFKNIKLINKEEDKNLKVNEVKDYSYAKETAKCVVGVSELFKASMSYPILFTAQNENYNAIALMGLKDGNNLFIDKEGNFKEDTYTPLFLRTYPFVFVQDEDKHHLGYDSDAKAINRKSGQSIFSKDGENTKYLDGVVEFLTISQNSIKSLNIFIKQLDEAGVLKKEILNVANGKYIIDGFYQVDEEKLNNLDKYILRDLVKSGAYKIAIAHLLSYNNFEKLVKLEGK